MDEIARSACSTSLDQKQSLRRCKQKLHRLQRKAYRIDHKLRMIRRSRVWRMREWIASLIRRVPGMEDWRLETPLPLDEDRFAPRRIPVLSEDEFREYERKHPASRMPKVSIIIVNYNGMEHLPACLESLFKTDYPSFDVTLVDNDSHDKSVEWILDRYPQVNILCSPENLGFGKANHLGISQTDGSIVVLLNNDTIVDRNWLWPLVEPLVDNEQLAATSSKLRFMEQPRVLNGVGGSMNRIGLAYDLGIHEVDFGQWDEPREILFPCGAACAIRRSVFEAVGGFDDAFFMYHEDVDLGWRIRLMGYSIQTAPKSIVYHRFGGTSSKSSSKFFREQLGLRHDLRSLIKNYQFRNLCKALPLFFLFLLKSVFKTQSLRHLQCIPWNLAHLRDTLKQRREIQRKRMVSDDAIASLIYPRLGVPFHEQDYTPVRREDYLRNNYRKSWVGMADKRWNSLGYGWHTVEVIPQHPRVPFRWTQREAVAYLWNRFGRGTLELRVLAGAIPGGTSRVFAVSINGKLVKRYRLNGMKWKTIRIEYDGEPGPLEVTIHTKNTWFPGRVFHNNDPRELGVGVRYIQFIPHAERPKCWNGMSVVIPTYNRCDKLQKVLEALERQTLAKDRYEIIVVDDGSTDATRLTVAQFQEESRMRLKYAHQQNKLQGAARNHGLTLASEELVLFIGDDIIPAGDFLEQHLNFHRENNPSGDVAVVGRIQWAPELNATPFMDFINDHGPQFGFAMMDHAGPWQFDCFYTSNISMPRSMLDALDYVFDEDFKQYGWEDAELGHRLERGGMRLMFNPEAIAYHDHPTTVSAFCRRQRNVGRCSRLFLEKHPQLETLLGGIAKMRPRARLKFAWKMAVWAVDILDGMFHMRLPFPCYAALLNSYYAQGVLEGQVEPCRQPLESTSCCQPTTDDPISDGNSNPSSSRCRRAVDC